MRGKQLGVVFIWGGLGGEREVQEWQRGAWWEGTSAKKSLNSRQGKKGGVLMVRVWRCGKGRVAEL